MHNSESPLTYKLTFKDHADSHDKEALILSTVHAIKLLTVATEPRDSFAVGTESTRIWNATVRRDPPVDPDSSMPTPCAAVPSGKIANPDGRSAT
jgi:hypothetical protein